MLILISLWFAGTTSLQAQVVLIKKFYESDGANKVDKTIRFDSVTTYSIYDTHGKEMLHGRSKTINVSMLARGVYYLVTGKTTEEFIKK